MGIGAAIGPDARPQKPQLTSVTSLANRATGTGLSLAFYAFALSYAAAPMLGMPFSGQSVVNLVANLPGWFVVLSKTALSGSFWCAGAGEVDADDVRFHTWNGIRHLSWDSGRCALLDLGRGHLAKARAGRAVTLPRRLPNLLADARSVLNLQTAYYAGYTVLGLTAVSTAYTVFLL